LASPSLLSQAAAKPKPPAASSSPLTLTPKSIVIESGGKDVKLTLTAAVSGADKLVGKKVTAVSSHKKVESLKEG
jgi:hypothetical protein